MVHALREVHRVLAPGGLLVDARPDSRVPAYAERRTAKGSKRFGIVHTSALELGNDGASDRAIELVVAEGLYRRVRQGRFWHLVWFDGLAPLRLYLWEHSRFVRRARWVVDAAARRRYAGDRFVIRRAVRYQIFKARPG